MLNPPCWPRIMKLDNGTLQTLVPLVGDVYVSEQTGKTYVCKQAGIFTDITKPPTWDMNNVLTDIKTPSVVDPELLEMQIYGE